MGIQMGSQVSFDYTLNVNSKVVETSQNKSPLSYVHGTGQIVPGLERQLEGLIEGDEKEVIVAPEEAYGPNDPKAIREVPRSMLPEGTQPQPGMYLQMNSPDGRSFTVKVVEVKEESVVLDFNHPLAGKMLNFKIKIISVQ